MYILSKMLFINKSDKNFYKIFNKYSKSLIKINEIGDKYNKPCIYIANHSKNDISGLLVNGVFIEKNVKIFVAPNKFFRDSIDDDSGCIFINNFTTRGGGGKYNETKELLKNQVEKGYSIICFPEYNGVKYNSKNVPLYDLRSGFFRIAKELNIPIQLMAVNWRVVEHKLIMPKLKNYITVKYGKMLDTSKELDEIMKDAKEELSRMIEEIM